MLVKIHSRGHMTWNINEPLSTIYIMEMKLYRKTMLHTYCVTPVPFAKMYTLQEFALRNAIVEKLKKENGLEYTAAQISCANGAKQSVCNAILVLVNPGDEVIVPAPYWVSYPEMVKLAEGTPVIVSASIEQDFKITPEQLEAAITPKTKALILCSPSNPTGSVYSKEELAGLAAVLAKHPQVIVLADEIYEHINYIGAHQSIAQFPEMKERTVIVRRRYFVRKS